MLILQQQWMETVHVHLIAQSEQSLRLFVVQDALHVITQKWCKIGTSAGQQQTSNWLAVILP